MHVPAGRPRRRYFRLSEDGAVGARTALQAAKAGRLKAVARLRAREHDHDRSAAAPQRTLAEPLLAQLSARFSGEELDRVRDAYEFAERSHEGQWRKSGDLYIAHPLAVAEAAAAARLDCTMVCVCLLHDVPEDDQVITLKLLDRLHNMRTIEHGPVHLDGARIGGKLVLEGAHLDGRGGRALSADNLTVDQDMDCDRLTADGEVLLGGHIGLLSFEGAALSNRGGCALMSDGLRVDKAMFCRNGFTAEGEVGLPGARIGGRLYFDGAKLSNPGGRALVASRLTVDQDMFCRRNGSADDGLPFRVEGGIDLRSAHIGGHLVCDGAELRNDSGPALSAFSLQVGQGMYLTGGFTATGGGEGVAVDLAGARVGGSFLFAPPGVEHEVKSQRLAVDGLTYPDVPRPISPEGWRELLRHGTPRYAAQPYQQLAAGYRARGDERQARETLIRQRDDQLARTHPRWPERLWGQVTKITLGYGYQPWRALLFLAAVVIVSCILAVALGSHGALTQTSQTATPGRPCTVVQQVSVGVDLNLPVGTSVARADCDLTADSASVTAAWLTVTGWILRLLALFIAGFTSAVRKT